MPTGYGSGHKIFGTINSPYSVHRCIQKYILIYINHILRKYDCALPPEPKDPARTGFGITLIDQFSTISFFHCATSVLRS